MEYILRRKIVEIGKKLYEKGLVVATDGNVSARLPDGNILITPSGVSKGEMRVEEIVKISPEGEVIGRGKPSSEYRLHLEVYRLRKDIHAVVHTHSPYATAFAVTHIPLEPLVAEAVLTNGKVPVSPYASPSTPELSKSISDLILNHNSILLANHGVLAAGKDLDEAYFRAERIEYRAKVVFLSRLLGTPKPVPEGEIERLLENWGLK